MQIRDEENWLPVPAFELVYAVSSRGQIKRTGSGKGARVGRILMQSARPDGYRAITLWVGNKVQCHLVHRIVASAFLGGIPAGKEVDHRDGNKANNDISNLELVTRSENIRHAIRTGLNRLVGEDNHQAILCESDVRQIRQLNKTGIGYKRLAARFGVKWETARDIVKRRIWKHVDPGQDSRTAESASQFASP